MYVLIIKKCSFFVGGFSILFQKEGFFDFYKHTVCIYNLKYNVVQKIYSFPRQDFFELLSLEDPITTQI